MTTLPAAAGRLLAFLARGYIFHFPVARGKGIVVRHVHTPAARSVPGVRRRADRAAASSSSGSTSGSAGATSSTARRSIRLSSSSSATRSSREPARSTSAPTSASYTVAAALRVGAAGLVVAVEADDEYVPRLRVNLARNGIENVSIVAVAAGGADGEAEFVLAADRAFSSIKPLVSYRAAGANRTVPLRQLDSIWAEAGEPAVVFVKIDVEGAELEVIAGAQRLLDGCHPALIVEVSAATEPQVQRRLAGRATRTRRPSVSRRRIAPTERRAPHRDLRFRDAPHRRCGRPRRDSCRTPCGLRRRLDCTTEHTGRRRRHVHDPDPPRGDSAASGANSGRSSIRRTRLSSRRRNTSRAHAGWDRLRNRATRYFACSTCATRRST